MISLDIEEVRKLLVWMENNKKDVVMVKQEFGSGIGVATVVVNPAGEELYDITNYELW